MRAAFELRSRRQKPIKGVTPRTDSRIHALYTLRMRVPSLVARLIVKLLFRTSQCARESPTPSMLTGGVRALRAVCPILGTLFAPRKIYSIQPESACSPFRRDLLGHYMSESNTQVVPCG